MLPKKLILIDYLTFDRAEIDFQKIRKALILGVRNNDVTSSNGAGKSNVLRSIPWCLWGVNPEAKDIDQNVRWGSDFCSVQFEFSHRKDEIKVIRTRNSKTNKSTLDLYINDVHSNGNTIADTTQKITDLINLDYNAYVNSCYIRQNDIHSLVNSEDKDKSRELFERLMGLDVYDNYLEIAEGIVAGLETERNVLFEYVKTNSNVETLITEQAELLKATELLIANHNATIASLRAAIATATDRHELLKKNIGSKESVVQAHADAETALTRMVADLDDLILKSNRFRTDVDSKKKEYQQTIAGESEALAESERWEKTVADGLAAQDKAAVLDTTIATKRAEIVELQKGVSAIEAKVGILKHDGDKIAADIESTKAKIDNPNIAIGSKCDSCLTDITHITVENYAQHLSEDIEKKKLEILALKAQALSFKPKRDADKAKIEELNSEISTLTVDKDALLKTIVNPATASSTRALLAKRIRDINNAKAELAKLDSSGDIAQWEASVEKKRGEVAAQRSIFDDLASRVDSTYEQDEEQIRQLKVSIDADNARVISLLGEIVLLNTKIDAAKGKLADFDIIKKKLSENQVALEAIESQLVTYRELVVAFSPRGIRYHILGKAIEELEREANEILPKLSQGNLRVRFQTKKEIQKSKKGNQEKLTFDAFINDGQKEQPFSSYSGGEQFRISFVIRVALSNLLLKRANTDLQFLVIDEAISPLDQAGIEMIIPTINELQNYFKVILVITHRSEVKQYFDEIITIKRNKYVSRIEA